MAVFYLNGHFADHLEESNMKSNVYRPIPTQPMVKLKKRSWAGAKRAGQSRYRYDLVALMVASQRQFSEFSEYSEHNDILNHTLEEEYECRRFNQRF